jgi:hypothetical protein
VVSLAAGGRVVVSLVAQPPPARDEILATFASCLGERYTTFLRQPV